MIPLVELPSPGSSVACRALANGASEDVLIVAFDDQVRVEYARPDAGTGERWVFLVRQFSRDDPALVDELSRLRPAA